MFYRAGPLSLSLMVHADTADGKTPSLLAKALLNPGMAIGFALAVVRGTYYRVKFKLLGRRVTIGRRFRVTGRLDIRGPGTVIFGDDCGVVSTYLAPTTLWTHSPSATIRLGNRVLLAGARFGCETEIVVNDMAGFADARIVDTDFHSTHFYEDRPRYNTSGRSKRVVIGRNAWIGAQVIILKGVTIGDNSVVAAGAVVVHNVAQNTIVLGNPAKVVGWVRSLGKWPGTRNAESLDPAPDQAAEASTGALTER